MLDRKSERANGTGSLHTDGTITSVVPAHAHEILVVSPTENCQAGVAQLCRATGRCQALEKLNQPVHIDPTRHSSVERAVKIAEGTVDQIVSPGCTFHGCVYESDAASIANAQKDFVANKLPSQGIE